MDQPTNHEEPPDNHQDRCVTPWLRSPAWGRTHLHHTRFIREGAGPCIRGYTVGMEIEEIQGMSTTVRTLYAAEVIGGESWIKN
jgi:hypothetical protein